MIAKMEFLSKITLIHGDITAVAADAIVNAANEWMLGGGGVDGAIHRAAGPELLDACRAVPEVRPGVRCPTGETRITPGFQLPAKYIIHTVGPIWRGGASGEPELLAGCYRNSLFLAARHGVQSIAFPAISCGAYRYPPKDASRIAVAEVSSFLAEHPDFEKVILVAFERKVYNCIEVALSSQ
jgi:O-acetyl-ADP-ribose deacetylase (regulator of RNase III)